MIPYSHQHIFETPSNTCLCGKTFAQTSALNNHLCSCRVTKKMVSFGLARAKELWENRKKKRQEGFQIDSTMVRRYHSFVSIADEFRILLWVALVKLTQTRGSPNQLIQIRRNKLQLPRSSTWMLIILLPNRHQTSTRRLPSARVYVTEICLNDIGIFFLARLQVFHLENPPCHKIVTLAAALLGLRFHVHRIQCTPPQRRIFLALYGSTVVINLQTMTRKTT